MYDKHGRGSSASAYHMKKMMSWTKASIPNLSRCDAIMRANTHIKTQILRRVFVCSHKWSQTDMDIPA
jgi:hypothetical protein